MAERKILVTGVNGQVGHELVRSLQGLGQIVALDRAQFDLSDPAKMRDVIQNVKPSLIVNPAAYTAVDKAETDRVLAFRINAEAPGIMAQEAKKLGAALIHYSTDYVYDGEKEGAYAETDTPAPKNVYGASKLAGEEGITAAGCAHLILRTSWVYGNHGGNFVKTMLRLGADREVLRVVGDQYGAPTWARTIADVTAHIVAQSVAGKVASVEESRWWSEKSGVYHLSGGGKTSWAGFATAIFANKNIACRVEEIPASEYPTPAHRPSNSVMSGSKLASTFGMQIPDWSESLRLCLA